jgi:hypothetical protein
VLTGGVAAVMLLAALAGCTGGNEGREDSAASPLPSRSVETQPTLEAKPVPMDVEVAKVVGSGLRPKQRRNLEQEVSRVLEQYFDDAYLGGEYPRRDFSAAFDTFSQGAARRAVSDRPLLTNAAVGPETTAVVPRARRARVDVLVPGRVAVGMTARVRLVFVREQVSGPAQRVTVSGRLLMSRNRAGRLKIFGYDVIRSSEPASGGERG